MEPLESRELLATVGNNLARGDQLLHFRLAISATGEYTQHFGSVQAAHQAVIDAVDAVNQIFESELSIRLDLVTGTETIFPDPNTDPFTYNEIGTMQGENQALLDSVIGSESYDVGHVFGKRPSGWAGGARIASLGTENKARGATNSATPTGDTWIKALAHEIGHQFRGLHTFNGVAGSCTSGARASLASFEPGSGTTIMSYGGSCGTDNVQSSPSKDPYYHAANFEDIHVFVGNLGSNDTSHAAPYLVTATGNRVPTVTGGNDYVIPARTPFELTANGNDADGDPLTYTWEQFDLGPAIALGSPDNGSSPLFRSFAPTDDPTRIFPRLESILTGTDSVAETLPTTSREINFRVTARDGKGGVNSDDVLIRSVDSGTPFAVTSPGPSTVWSGGTTQTINWSLAGSDVAPINTAQVRILLSTDSGQSFPFELAVTDNDGSHVLQVPNIDTTTARIKIEAVDNVFFAINSDDIRITQNAGSAFVNISESAGETRATEAGPDDAYVLSLSNDPGGIVDVTVTADAESVVSLNGVDFAPSQTVRFDSTLPRAVFVRAVDDLLEDGRHLSTLTHQVTFSTSPLYSTSTLIDNLTVAIVDDELPPVAGADYEWFNGDFSPSRSPENWAQNPWYAYGNTNLLRDDGVPTSYDITYSYSGSSWAHTAPIFSSSVPRHDPPLQPISGYSRRANYLEATFRDLTPGVTYGVYVFGLTHSGQFISQNITITGATTLPTFNQTMSDRFLQINGEQGSSSRTLKSYELEVEADSQGRIRVYVQPVNGSPGAALAGLAIREIPQVAPAAEVVGRHLFYNDSAFDDGPAANSADDSAIAIDKQALLPGDTGQFANYVSDPRGITGLMVDIDHLPDPTALTAADFTFRVGTDGNPNTWPLLNVAPQVSVRAGAGNNGSDRVMLTWPPGSIVNRWLQVSVNPTGNTGLAIADVFYFGNAVGETGDTDADTQVGGTDFQRVRSAPRTFLNPAAIDDPLDLNRDRRVNAGDLLIIRDHSTTLQGSLPLWQAPGSVGKTGQLAADQDPGAGDWGPDGDHEDHRHEEIVHPIDDDPLVEAGIDFGGESSLEDRSRVVDRFFAERDPVQAIGEERLSEIRQRLELHLETIASHTHRVRAAVGDRIAIWLERLERESLEQTDRGAGL